VNEKELKQRLLEEFQTEGKNPTPKELNQAVKRVLSSREIQSALKQIEEAGGEAVYLSADVTDRSALKEKLSPYAPKINGMLHGAGALADKYIQDKTEQDFELVYGVKVDGLKNLLSFISPSQLDYLILFSSVAGFYGNAGQADYSLSNEVLNKYAHFIFRSHPACRVLALDWGPWDGGMVTPRLKRILKRRNVEVIPVEEGTAVLADLVAGNGSSPQWVVGHPLPFPPSTISEEKNAYRIDRNLKLEKNPFLADHVIGGNAVLPIVSSASWMINACEGLYPGYSFHELRDYQVFKGIIFDHTLTEKYTLELKELEKTAQALTFAGEISSQSQSGSQQLHYRGQIQLRKTLPEQPVIDDYLLEKRNSIPGSALYQDQILFHGPSFQGVQEVINHSQEQLTTTCQLKEVPPRKQGQFPVSTFNPFLADIQLQSLLIWAQQYRDVIGLPLKIARGVQYAQIPFDFPIFVTTKIVSQTKHNLVADVFSHDGEGNVFVEVHGAEITLSKRLLPLFHDNQLPEEPVWI
jgi:hypothetical protein